MLKMLKPACLGVFFAIVGCGQVETTERFDASLQSTERKTIVVNRTTNLLTVYTADGKPLKDYTALPVITGKDYSTPRGSSYFVEYKEKCPIWDHPRLGYSGPCAPDNPLGRRWIQWNTSLYGIHGNNAEHLFKLPASERRLSHGCIRMRNADVERLYEIVRDGDKVIVE